MHAAAIADSTYPCQSVRAGRGADLMIVYPGERLDEALRRHCRDTGHRGPVTVVAYHDQLCAA